MIRALSNFSSEPWENSQKPTEYKAVVYAMCYFHSVVVERKKFGAQGWNRAYPFNVGDLITCVEVFFNYEERPKIPWDDLRYIYGEIMYGGHITDDWDRVLCSAYLQNLIHSGITEDLELAPGMYIPTFHNYKEALEAMRTQIPPESPLLYGLHPNAEIGFRTQQAERLFATINELQPTQEGSVGLAAEDDVKVKLDELMANLPEVHNLQDISERLDDDRTPQAHVFYQECERANTLRERLSVVCTAEGAHAASLVKTVNTTQTTTPTRTHTDTRGARLGTPWRSLHVGTHAAALRLHLHRQGQRRVDACVLHVCLGLSSLLPHFPLPHHKPPLPLATGPNAPSAAGLQASRSGVCSWPVGRRSCRHRR